MDRRRLAEGVLVAVVLLVGVAAYLRQTQPPEPPPPLAASRPAPAAPEPAAPLMQDQAPQSSLMAVEPQELTFTRIMDILGAEADKPEVAPVAKQFKKEFLAQAELKKALDDYRDQAARGMDPPAAEFLHTLREFPSFRKLSAKWGGGAGKSAMLLMAKNPDIRAFLKEERRGIATAKAGPVQGRGPVQGMGAVPPARGAFASGGASRGFSATGGSAAYASAGPADIGAGGNAIGAGAAASATLSAGGASGRSDGGGVTPLGKTGDACSQQMDHMIKDWLARFGLNAAAYMSDTGSGIWDQCFKRGELQKCDTACHNQPQASDTDSNAGCAAMGHTKLSAVCAPPSDPSYWATCMEAFGDELQCVRKCNEQGPCKIPSDVWSRWCEPTPRSECSANGGRGAPNGGGSGCQGEGCSPEGVKCWAKGIGLPDCVGQQFCGDFGHLPNTLPELVNWGNDTGRRNTSNGVWRCR